MELSGETAIPAPRQKVWQALNDPEVLKDCIPGCRSLVRNESGDLDAVVKTAIGPVSATFKGRVAITEAAPPSRCRLSGEGKGGPAGFARGIADVDLAEDDGGTRLSYRADVTVGGKLAQLGGRLVAATAQRYARDFFACLSDHVGGTRPAVAASAAELTAGAEPTAGAAPADRDAPPGRSEAIETFGEKELEENVHAEKTLGEELEIEAGKGTLGGPMVWGLIAFAVVVILLLALR
jgi:carbon monoxide dehydrogenase subunit G